MSPSPTRTPPPAVVDLDYHMEDFEPGAGTGRDSTFYHRRTDRAVLDEALGSLLTNPSGPLLVRQAHHERNLRTARPEPVEGRAAPLSTGPLSRGPGRVLDVACGSGELAARLGASGWQAWGLEASDQMIGLGRWLGLDQKVITVRGIAEALPFPDGSFDCVLCKGSLDHFADQGAFMEEAARVLRPDGRLVIALANFDALSRRLGRGAHAVARLLGAPTTAGRPYWQPPPTHTVRGNLAYVRSLGNRPLTLERCYGVSLLHHLPPWRIAAGRMPPRLSWAIMTALDGIARRCPAAADMIVSVWRRQNSGTIEQWNSEP